MLTGIPAADRSIPLNYFTRVANVGDMLNPFLISRLFNLNTRLASDLSRPHLVAIGSFIGAANPFSHIWGTGAISAEGRIPIVAVRNVHALRGKLTHALLNSRGAQLPDMPFGDPGFLIAMLKDTLPRERKYRLGVAPHYVDRQHPWVQKLLGDPTVLDLNVHRPVEEFLRNISECEAVVSSSLHGLVIAEALGIPNIWIQLSDEVIGDGFKFHDWYSVADRPQKSPELPTDQKADDIIAELCRKAVLHEMRIDTRELAAAFPTGLQDMAETVATSRADLMNALAEIRGLNQRFFNRGVLERSQELVINGAVTEYIQSEGDPKPRHQPLHLAVPTKPPIDTVSPAVACVMVTADRPAQARLAVECYRRQSWPNRTLTILDTGSDDSLDPWLTEINDPSISYHRADRGQMTLGDLRNEAVSRSCGEFICNWDDDDLCHPLRIELQMTAISQYRAQACLLGRLLIWWPFKSQLVASHGQIWEGTILTSRTAMTLYASKERGEDSVAIHALRQRNRVAYLNAPELYVYVRHQRNTWEDDHFDAFRRKALTQYSVSEYAGVLPWLRNVFPIDEYLEAIQV